VVTVRRAAALLVALFLGLAVAGAQAGQRPLTISIASGIGWPATKSPLREFWRLGPAGSLTVSSRVNRRLSLGAGIDAAIYRFSNAAFRARFPGVSPLNRKTAFTHVFVFAKIDLSPGHRLAPFVQGSLGAARLTPASYQATVGGVRRVYYEIPPRARLALGLSVGADLMVLRWFAVSAEVRATMVHNDPNAGIEPALLGGFRFTLP
jgi:hypothetical protein